MEWYKGNLEWLPDRTIFMTKGGSHAYGTNLPTSDLDIRGICIPPKEYFHGFLHKFEEAECKGDLDAVITDIRKLVELASKCNPNVIELLFTDDSDWISPGPNDNDRNSAAWWRLWCGRHLFISKEAKHRFSGYAFNQLRRIQSHRYYLLNPPKKHPERADFDLPEFVTLEKDQLNVVNARIRKLEDQLGGKGWTKDKVSERDEEFVTTVVGQIDISDKLIPLIIAERKYNSAMRNWASYEKWKLERNSVRSELEGKFGYDTKHAMHLVRLMRMATEILDHHKVIVKRHDAQELLEIRRGMWSFDTLMTWAEDTEVKLEKSYITSTLPREPDREAIDKLLVAIVNEYL
jgi:predicted nucleotidyltransferase